jgi:UDP-2-acetamido-2,6-beta-L-arabino-hexul-4-ose reductase
VKQVAITGGFGFLGWHTACRLRALHGVEPIRLGRQHLADPDGLSEVLVGVDTVIHIAGVNRADTEAEVESGNAGAAESLAAALRASGRPIDVVYANSVQAELDNAYGRGKAHAAGVLAAACADGGGHFADLLLPNLFGEHGRPGYNSFVATFAHEVAAGRTPSVTGDREIELLHAQDAAAALIAAAGQDVRTLVHGEAVGIGTVLGMFEEFHELYGGRGEIPDVSTRLRLNLFNTYRAAAFADAPLVAPQVHSDDRGDLFETVRSHGGTGMSYASTTKPGQKRGEHYHLHKIERFVVVKGEAEIQLRRLLHDDVVTLRVGGDRPVFVDMPTLWVHNIRNVGEGDLLTVFWADQLLDPENPDQFPETIAAEAHA